MEKPLHQEPCYIKASDLKAMGRHHLVTKHSNACIAVTSNGHRVVAKVDAMVYCGSWDEPDSDISKPRPFLNLHVYLDIKDESHSRYFDGVPLQVEQPPAGKTYWTSAYKKLLAQAANDRIRRLLADDEERHALLSKADTLAASIIKSVEAAQVRQLEEEAREAEARANALPDAKRLWADLQEQGYAAERLFKLSLDWTPGPDLQGLIEFFAARVSLFGRKIGIFESGSEIIDGIRTPILWCQLPVNGYCSIATLVGTSTESWITIKQPMQRVAFSKHGVYLSRAITDKARALNCYRVKRSPDWNCIPEVVYGQLDRLICSDLVEHVKHLEQQIFLSDAIYEMLGASSYIEHHIGRFSRGSQACTICHRKLKAEGSVWRGIGPECWERLQKHMPGLKQDWLRAHERRPSPVLRFRPEIRMCKPEARDEARALQGQWAMSFVETVDHLKRSDWMTEREASERERRQTFGNAGSCMS